ncbi:MAG: transporter [Hyphomonas sp.]
MRRAALFLLSAAMLASAPALAAPDCAALLANDETDLDQLVDAGCELSAEQISRRMDNPVGELVMLPVQYEWLSVEDPILHQDHVVETLKIIPTVPVRIGDWRLVNRTAFVFPKIPVDTDAVSGASLRAEDSSLVLQGGPLTGDPFAGSTTGFGDLVYVGLLTPKKTHKVGHAKLIWAAGPTVVLPTASEDFLGQGKYQAGPAAALAYLGPDWTLGVFPQHRWSFAGDKDRASVNQTSIQYFVYRKLPDQWSLGASPTITIDWTADDEPAVNLPVGIGLNKTVLFGKLPARISLETTYYPVRSNGLEPEWGVKFSITPVIPAAFLR